jgi:hypothetical protein
MLCFLSLFNARKQSMSSNAVILSNIDFYVSQKGANIRLCETANTNASSFFRYENSMSGIIWHAL